MTFFLTSAGPGKGGDLGGLKALTGTASNRRRRPARAARRHAISQHVGAGAVNAARGIGKGPGRTPRV
jgi:hypothetical protein